MVAYGQALRKSRRVGWENAYVDYNRLKTALVREEEISSSQSSSSLSLSFEVLLQQEIEKVSLFALRQQGEIAQQIGALRLMQHKQQQHDQASHKQVEGDLAKNNYVNEHDDEPFDEETALLPSSASSASSSASSSYLSASSMACIFPAMQDPSFYEYHSSTSLTERRFFLLDAYTHWGIELLHLQRYICINTMGMRKIVKKYHKHRNVIHKNDKRKNKEEAPNNKRLMNLLSHQTAHGQQLANSGASIDALLASLTQASCQLEPAHRYQYLRQDRDDDEQDGDDSHHYAWVRLHCTVSLIQVLRNYAHRMNESFVAFLSSKAMIAHQQVDAASSEALSLILRFQPDLLQDMEPLQLDQWYLREQQANGLLESIPALPSSSSQESNNSATMSWGGVDSASLTLNLLSTLLYTVNYYIVAPTANRYALLLGVDGAFGATLVGASSLAALGAAFLYSAWYTRFSFRSALLFSAICPCIGNLLYSMAISYSSLSMALWGRILVGLGSAEVVNRQLIAACVSYNHLTSASAYFVAAGAVGMSIGPLLAAILDIFAGRDLDIDLDLPFTPVGGIIYDHVTSPGFVMAGLWCLQGVALVIAFREPRKIHTKRSNHGGSDETRDPMSHSSTSFYASFDERAKATLESVGVSLAAPDVVGRDNKCENPSLWSRCRAEVQLMQTLVFGNVALPITLLLFGFIELVDEVLISSCSMVCRRYFGWNGSTAGFILASLGSLVLPAHFVVEKAAHQFEERSIIKYSIVFIILGLVAIFNYEGLIFDCIGLAAEAVKPHKEPKHMMNSTDHVAIAIDGKDILHFLNHEREVPYDWGAGQPVYLVFLSAIFMGTIVLEGVDTSVMAKATPPALNDTFINSGLLATLVGTLGRVAGDSMITLSALVDKDVFTDFVNATFFPIIPLALLGYYLVRQNYNELL